jgi:hypothetical protein
MGGQGKSATFKSVVQSRGALSWLSVEERGKTIEQSEIVWVRTYPPCTRDCLTKSFLGSPQRMSNKWFYMFPLLKPHTYIWVLLAHWRCVIKFYCWLLKNKLFTFLYFKLYIVTSWLGATPRWFLVSALCVVWPSWSCEPRPPALASVASRDNCSEQFGTSVICPI